MGEIHALSFEVFSLSKLRASANWQKSRLSWLREGDANSKFFHGIMSARRRSNARLSIPVDGVQIEGVEGVRGAVFNHFKNHFKLNRFSRPGVDDLMFNSLSDEDGAVLTTPFSVEEIKQALWNCDSYKSL